jgi:hypothetical protein
MNAAALIRDEAQPAVAPVAQPNEFDRHRIERALARRERYRYVTPRVHAVRDGYRIDSPCCSRNVDPDGGVIDVAMLLYVPGDLPWWLYRREHVVQQWLLHHRAQRLDELLELLRADPRRLFWQ